MRDKLSRIFGVVHHPYRVGMGGCPPTAYPPRPPAEVSPPIGGGLPVAAGKGSARGREGGNRLAEVEATAEVCLPPSLPLPSYARCTLMCLMCGPRRG